MAINRRDRGILRTFIRLIVIATPWLALCLILLLCLLYGQPILAICLVVPLVIYPFCAMFYLSMISLRKVIGVAIAIGVQILLVISRILTFVLSLVSSRKDSWFVRCGHNIFRMVFFGWFAVMVIIDRLLRKILVASTLVQYHGHRPYSLVNAPDPRFQPGGYFISSTSSKKQNIISDFDPLAAYSLAVAAKLSYEDLAIIYQELRDVRSNYDVSATFFPIHYRNTHGYVVATHEGNDIVVVFRGTQPLNLQNISTDLDHTLLPLHIHNRDQSGGEDMGQMHSGFLAAMGSTQDFDTNEQGRSKINKRETIAKSQNFRRRKLHGQTVRGRHTVQIELPTHFHSLSDTIRSIYIALTTVLHLLWLALLDFIYDPRDTDVDIDMYTTSNIYDEALDKRVTDKLKTRRRSSVHRDVISKSGIDQVESAVHEQETTIAKHLLDAHNYDSNSDFESEAETDTSLDSNETLDNYRHATRVNSDRTRTRHCDSAYVQACQGITRAVAVITRRKDKQQIPIRLFVCGHSLGGAIAYTFLARLVQCQSRLLKYMTSASGGGLYTYGAPRVGDSQFSRFMNVHYGDRMFRVVYDNDVVPRLLPWGSYDELPGELVHVQTDYSVVRSLNGVLRSISFLRPAGLLHPRVIVRMPRETLLRCLYRLLLPFFVNDHLPGDYVCALANYADMHLGLSSVGKQMVVETSAHIL